MDEILHRKDWRAWLFTGILLAAGLLFIPFGGSETLKVPTHVSNVFQESLETDWKAIALALEFDASYVVRDFRLEYLPTDELQKVDLTILELTDSTKKTFYRIALDQEIGHYVITKTTSSDPDSLNRLQVPLMFETLTPETLRALVPEESCDFVQLAFDSYYHPSLPAMPSGSQLYALHDQNVIGPLEEGNGCLTAIWPMHQKENGSFGQSPRYFLLGGTEAKAG